MTTPDHNHADRDQEQGGGMGRAARAVGGTLAALVLYLCVPAVLVLIARVPVPHPFTVHSVVTLGGLVDLLALAVWVTWAVEMVKLVRAVIDRLRHPERAMAAGLRDHLALKIAALVLVLTPLVVARATTPPVTAPAGPATASAQRSPAPIRPGAHRSPSRRSPAAVRTSGQPAPADGAAGHRADPTAPVRLPSGSVVAGTFAAGVLAAVALGRLRGRHAYRYRPPEPGLDLTPEPPRPTLRYLATAMGTQDEPTDRDGAAGLSAMADDDPDHRERPDLIEVGALDGELVHLMLSELAGVTIAGPDAEAVMAAWVTALMVRAGPFGAEVAATRAALDRLVGTALGTRIELPGLQVMEGPGEVLRALDATVLARTRLLAEAEVADVVAYRRANPRELVPVVLAVLDRVPAEDAGRWAATLDAGARLGFAALVLDPNAATPARLGLGADRVVVSAAPDDLVDRLVGVQLFGLAPEEAAEVVAALAEAEQRPDSTGATGDKWVDDPVEEPGTGPAPVCWPRSEGGGEDRGVEPPETERWPDTVAAPRVEPTITVTLFGPYEIRVGGTLVTAGLRTPAKELLAWLCLRPDGASVEAAVDALWPDTEPARVHKQFWLGAANLRTRLGAESEPHTKVLVQTGPVYRLDTDAIGCDLWQFQAALTAAARAGEEPVARDALRRAVDCYRGDLLAGTDYPWVEPIRQDLRRRALDAHLRLADLEGRLGAPEAAEAVLQRAVGLDRYSEEPYRRLMVLQGARGRSDQVAETWQLLERRLDEIDVDVEPATLRLYRSLTTGDAGPPEVVRPVRLPL